MQTTSVVLNGVDLEKFAIDMEAITSDPKLAKFKFTLDNLWVDGGYNQSVIGDFYGAGKVQRRETPFIIGSDESSVFFGKDKAPNPLDYVLHALASSLTTSIIYHAAIRGHEIKRVTTNVEGDIDMKGSLGLEPKIRNGFNDIKVSFDIQGDFTEEEKLEILGLIQFSPVLDILSNGVNVKICLGSKQIVKQEFIDC